jgi:hypothetical protein
MFITTGIKRKEKKVYKPALLAGAVVYLVASPGGALENIL